MAVLPRSAVHLDGELGSGNFGTVFAGMVALPGAGARTACAVKEPNEEGLRDFDAELQIMAKLVQLGGHPHIVAVLGSVKGQKGRTPMLVLELCPLGSLKALLKSQRDCPPPVREMVGFGCDVADAMSFLQSNLLLHRDLAARNVLVTEDRRCKIGDFGLSKDVGVKGPPPCFAPPPCPQTASPTMACGVAQRGTARHSAAQRGTARHSAARRPWHGIVFRTSA